ncbi:MAG: glycosyltransferase family 39 protein, partial [Deltaproteobacteria bacterium]|nr:glycosyltransferase family 39 protein [Deltaproteobacteria bacterium]
VYALYRVIVPGAFATFASGLAAVHVVTVFSWSLVSAIAAALLYLWLRRAFSPGASLAASTTSALGSILFPYSSAANAQVLVAACYVIAAYAVSRSGEERNGAWCALAGFAVGTAECTEPIAIIGIAAIMAMLAVRRTPVRGWMWFFAGAAPTALLLGTYNLAAFGSPFVTSYAYQNPVFNTPGAVMGVFVAPSLSVLAAITVLPVRGLLWMSPVFAVAPLGIALLWRNRAWRDIAIVVTVIALASLMFNMSYATWHGGWCVGPRLLLPAMPFFAATIAPVWDRYAVGRAPIVALVLIGVVIQLMVSAVNPWAPQMTHVTNPLVQYIWTNFSVGQLSINNYPTFGETPSLFPARAWSLVSFEERFAAYNLGELIGLPGRASLVPLLAAWGAAALTVRSPLRRLLSASRD